tara:strand:- start:218 stop:1486 length:1269 start_codon:yes stop_codon:yes gene_type:complete
MILNKEQSYAYQSILKGNNLFITGGGGVGKTALLNYFIKKHKNKYIGVTSTTGTSAILINGTTLHSFLGLGTGKQNIDVIQSNVNNNKYLKKRWINLRLLIIDEISMLSSEFFDKIELLARLIRNNEKPFGGIQLILSGDFCQLSPIDTKSFCFEANSWNLVIDKIIYLHKIIRQENMEFQKCLSNIRLGITDDFTKDIINSRINVSLKNSYGITPTKLFSKNINVDNTNKNELNKLTQINKKYEYKMISIFNNNLIAEKYKKNLSAVENLELCLGCQVMLIFNLDISNKLINGSRGIVTDFIYQNGSFIPLVKFLNGIEIPIDYHIWKIEEEDKLLGTITQIPLKLAYAFSIHKSQGSSLDYAILDLSQLFDYGMAYVALSRVRDLNGLTITSINWNKVNANPKAISFYNSISQSLQLESV